MLVKLQFIDGMKIIGSNEQGFETSFDSHHDIESDNTASTPMEILLQALGSCSLMDVIAILRKKRKTISDLRVVIDGTRQEEHPKVFTDVKIKYILTSPDCEIGDLERAVNLSQTTYCSVSAMFQRAGCKITWSAEVQKV